MTARLTPEQEAEIKRRAQFANAPDDIRALLAEIDALRESLDDMRMALYLERVDNAFKTALWETAIKDAAQLRKERDEARAGLVWSDESPTEPGCYWIKESGFPEGVANVHEDAGGRMRVIWASGHSSLVSDVLHCQWAGPIAPPEAKP